MFAPAGSAVKLLVLVETALSGHILVKSTRQSQLLAWLLVRHCISIFPPVYITQKKTRNRFDKEIPGLQHFLHIPTDAN